MLLRPKKWMTGLRETMRVTMVDLLSRCPGELMGLLAAAGGTVSGGALTPCRRGGGTDPPRTTTASRAVYIPKHNVVVCGCVSLSSVPVIPSVSHVSVDCSS